MHGAGLNADFVVGDIFRRGDRSGESAGDHEGVFSGVVGFGEVNDLIPFLIIVEAGDGHIQLAACNCSHQAVERHVHPLELDAHTFGNFSHQLDIEPGLVAGFIEILVWGVIGGCSDRHLFCFLDLIEN